MAGDWIKMRVDLAYDPAVVGIGDLIAISEDEIVGKLHRIWSWADRHTTDGHAPNINAKWVDRYLSCPGFAEAMVAVGWLILDEKGITFPDYEKHNGENAKKRSENTIRQRMSRKSRDKSATGHQLGAERCPLPRPFVRHVLTRDNYTCVFCGQQSDPKIEASRRRLLSVDHLKPVARGGMSVVENLVVACIKCNMEKTDRTPEEWGLLPTFLQNGVSYVNGAIVNLSRDCRAKSATREEEIREDNKDNTPLPPLPENLALSQEFVSLWGRWLSHRREKRRPMTQTAFAEQIKRLSSMGLDRALAALSLSLANGWTGIFEEDQNHKNNGKPQRMTPAELAAKL